MFESALTDAILLENGLQIREAPAGDDIARLVAAVAPLLQYLSYLRQSLE